MSDIIPVKPKPFRERIRIIVEGMYHGKDIGDKNKPGTIAHICGVTARTITRDKDSIEYSKLADIFLDQYLQELAAVQRLTDEEGNPIMMGFVLAEKGKLVRAMIPRRIEAKAEIRQVVIKPTFNKLLEADYKVLEDESDTG